jgi:hypothetical protein
VEIFDYKIANFLNVILLYCCFNGCDKSRNIGVSIPRFAKKLRAMMHSAELKEKDVSATPRNAT